MKEAIKELVHCTPPSIAQGGCGSHLAMLHGCPKTGRKLRKVLRIRRQRKRKKRRNLPRIRKFFVKIKFHLPNTGRTMKFGVVVFPGSNCDHDAWYAVRQNLGQEAEFIWHDSDRLGNLDAVILPGGFAYGDYLRCGAIAKFSPVMQAVKKFAGDGGLVLGICNGFQILVEAGLLPGALVKNAGLKFVCREVRLRTETTDSPFTAAAQKGQILRVPIAHGEGCYVADEHTLDELEAENRVLFRYLDNPNGSARDIAGILNRERNVMGLMPHPERASDPLMGSTDGLVVFQSMVSAFAHA
jgi:phosphoribosylformylglycinamidine synthase subunit PurQ / glutaminase